MCLARNRHSHRPDVAIRVLEHHVAPSVPKIHCGLNDFRSSSLCPFFNDIRIDPHHSQFRAGSTRTANFQPFEQK